MKRLRLEKVEAISAIHRFKPSRPGSWPGMKPWLMKSGAIISSIAFRSALTRASIKRRTRAMFSCADIEILLLANSHLSPLGRHHGHDATRRALAHRASLLYDLYFVRYFVRERFTLGPRGEVGGK